MSSTPSDLKGKLATKAEAANLPAKREKTVFDMIEDLKPQLARALPEHLKAERMIRIALTAVRTTTKLQSCNPQSLLAAVMLAGQLGLEPGPLGHAYLVPYGNEVQFIVGYRGLIDLMWRSGKVQSVAVHEVCERDEFQFEYGLDEKLTHRPSLTDRGPVKCYYGVVRLKDGGHHIHVMSREDVDAIRKRSRAGNNGPWQTDYDAMARKTVLRQMARWLPLSVEVQQAVAHDEGIHAQIVPDVVDEVPTFDATAEAGPSESEGDGEPARGSLHDLLGGEDAGR